MTHNQTTQLHKLLISRDSHGYPNDLLEKVIIFHHFPGAPTDLLEKIIIFRHSQGAPTDLLGKIIIFRHWPKLTPLLIFPVQRDVSTAGPQVISASESAIRESDHFS